MNYEFEFLGDSRSPAAGSPPIKIVAGGHGFAPGALPPQAFSYSSTPRRLLSRLRITAGSSAPYFFVMARFKRLRMALLAALYAIDAKVEGMETSARSRARL